MSELDLQIGLDVIRSYRRLAYTPWYALAEFIDNSTQSYRDNRQILDAAFARERSHLRVLIEYDKNAGLLILTDNAMGMSFLDLKRALHIGKPPLVTSGRSQFGLGLKTAACWFGDKWAIRTKKLGESEGFQVDVDVEKVASGNRQTLPSQRFGAPLGDHYTVIRIESLNVQMQGRRLGKTKESLRSMYRVDIRDSALEIRWDTSPLIWNDDLELLDREDGPARKPFEFGVGDRRVRGWAGVLAPGSSGRSNAGFALIRRGRLIRGWPEGWRPEAIFGPPPGRNDLINQRVVGEIHLDEFDVTHTKDDILWRENEEDLVQDNLKDDIVDVIKLAREYRHEKVALARIPVDGQKLSFDAVIQDSDLGGRFVSTGRSVAGIINDIAPPEVIALLIRSLAKTLSKETMLLQLGLGDDDVMNLFTSGKIGSEALFLMLTESAPRALIINAAHPICEMLESSEALRVHLQHAVADGIVLWARTSKRIGSDPSSSLTLKDALLRFMSRAPR